MISTDRKNFCVWELTVEVIKVVLSDTERRDGEFNGLVVIDGPAAVAQSFLVEHFIVQKMRDHTDITQI